MLDCLTKLKVWGKVKMYDFLHDEEGAVDIIAIVVLIGIVIILAVVFKDAISDLIKNLLKTIDGSAKDAIKPE